MSEHRDLPPVMHRQRPRDYIETGPLLRPVLSREKKRLLGLLVCIALTGAALIWIGVQP